jgi:RNA polymerase sigma-70 factor (ECF subfamily)
LGTFPETQWSRVVRAGNPDNSGAREALESLCSDYWYPLYVLARRRGWNQDDAADIVQGFLTDLIDRGDLNIADPARGRFRSFLSAACLHYMSHQRDQENALKRGGGVRHISIDVLDAECRYGSEPSHELTAERLFERRWALELLGRVLARLEAEALDRGQGVIFDRLRSTLEGHEPPDNYREIGAALGMSEGAVKVAAHRLRGRYRELLRDEVSRTVDDRSEIDDEIDQLLTALR